MAGDLLQFRYKTGLSSEEYVKQRAWNDAIPPPCPWCRPDTCQLAPHGFYRRVKPNGTLVRRFICRTVMRTVSRLPDCYATRVTGSLEEVEEAVATAAGAATRAQAVDWARPPGKGSPATARRWLERRMGWVRELLGTVKGLCPERFAGVEPTLEGFGQELGRGEVLRGLREVAAKHLGDLPAPVGFRCRGALNAGVRAALAEKQYWGLSPPGAAV